MILLQRPALTTRTAAALADATATLSGAGDELTSSARKAWRIRSSTRRELKRALEEAAHRPAFCMYCYESRGTDVDHFEPIAEAPLRTFDWQNHLLACGFCNQQAKKEIFPRQTGSGAPLLLDPFADDSAQHMTIGPSGSFTDLTNEGAETIRVLGLNARSQLVRARAVSWRNVLSVFERVVRDGRTSPMTEEDVADLRFLPVVDAFHHFAHDTAAGTLGLKAVPGDIEAVAQENLPLMRAVFPLCSL